MEPKCTIALQFPLKYWNFPKVILEFQWEVAPWQIPNGREFIFSALLALSRMENDF